MSSSSHKENFLHSALLNTPITISDIGASGGIDPLFGDVIGEFPVRVTGFEPAPAEFAKLQKRTDAKYFDYAISDKDGKARFFAQSTVGRLHTKREDGDGRQDVTEIDVVVRSIDSLVGSGEINAPDIIKTDIEGFDFLALKGAQKSLEQSTLCVK